MNTTNFNMAHFASEVKSIWKAAILKFKIKTSDDITDAQLMHKSRHNVFDVLQQFLFLMFYTFPNAHAHHRKVAVLFL